MAEIIPLRGSPHEQTRQLLPWRNNGTLNADEQALVEAHLAECAECRADAKADSVLARQVSGLSLDTQYGWAALQERMEQPRAAESLLPTLLRRRVPMGWMLLGQAAAVALFLGVFAAYLPDPQGSADYHALGTPLPAQEGNALIVFRPDTSESAMRHALLTAGARVIDGPNASGAYVLRVDQAARAVTLEALRGMPHVVIAEPIDGGEGK